MGTNTLTTVSGTSDADDFNQFQDAVGGDFIPRSSGAPTALAGSYGTPTYKWKRIYGSALFVNGDPVGESAVQETTGIISGKHRAESRQPTVLKPSGPGGGGSFTIQASVAEPLTVLINGVEYTLTSTLTKALTPGLLSNRIATTNITTNFGMLDLNAAQWGQVLGQYDFLSLSSAQSEVTARVGQVCGFLGGFGASLVRIDSATNLNNAIHGGFYDVDFDPVIRTAPAASAQLELYEMHWVFLHSDLSTISTTTKTPQWGVAYQGTPTTGEFLYRHDTGTWQKYNGSTWDNVEVCLLGQVILADSYTAYCRTEHFLMNCRVENSLALSINSASVTINSKFSHARVGIGDTLIEFLGAIPETDLTSLFSADYPLVSAKRWHIYLDEDGGFHAEGAGGGPIWFPYLRGMYHPHHLWRCIGFCTRTASTLQFFKCQQTPETQQPIFVAGAASSGIVTGYLYGTTSAANMNNDMHLLGGRTEVFHVSTCNGGTPLPYVMSMTELDNLGSSAVTQATLTAEVSTNHRTTFAFLTAIPNRSRDALAESFAIPVAANVFTHYTLVTKIPRWVV